MYTNNDLVPSVVLHEPDLNETEQWVTLVYNSNTTCPSQPKKNIAFLTDVLCDKQVTGKGNAKII